MTQPRQSDPQFKLRLPKKVLNDVAALADKNNRSINAEIVTRLEASIEPPAGLKIEEIVAKIRLHQNSEERQLLREFASLLGEM